MRWAASGALKYDATGPRRARRSDFAPRPGPSRWVQGRAALACVRVWDIYIYIYTYLSIDVNDI